MCSLIDSFLTVPGVWVLIAFVAGLFVQLKWSETFR
jgi:hypothetical protein